MDKPAHAQHARGLAITAIGGMSLTIDIPLIRLADGEPWSILMVRGATTVTVALLAWLVLRSRSSSVPPLIPGKPGWAVAGLYALSSITFITAVYTTATADLVFILAFNSMFSALLSWIFLKERPRPATLIAMVVMLVGVSIIVGGSLGNGNLLGNAMALCSALCIAMAITITRATGLDMGFTSLIAVSAPALLAAWMVSQHGFSIAAPWWILLNGAVVTPVAFFCLASGPKYITGPEVAMFYLLETGTGADLGVDDLRRDADGPEPDRRRDPDRDAVRPLSVAASPGPTPPRRDGGSPPGVS